MAGFYYEGYSLRRYIIIEYICRISFEWVFVFHVGAGLPYMGMSGKGSADIRREKRSEKKEVREGGFLCR